MNFGFTEEQDMIRKSARDLVRGKYGFDKFRELTATETGYCNDLYTAMAEQGWLGTVFPEDYDGIGLGYVDLICIMEELGKGQMTEPIISSALLGANAVFFGGSEAQKKEIIPQVVAGELKLAVGAYELDGRYNLAHVATQATAAGEGFTISGKKSFVDDAATADKIIVSARTSGGTTDEEGITLFIIDAKAAGVTITPIRTMDRRKRATVELKGVKVGKDAVIGGVGKALPILTDVIDRATVALCAEMLGGMEAALEMSVKYAGERVQFGKPIGSFQAMKHKAANMYVMMETARSATYYAAMAVDQDLDERKTAISCAKALCSDNYLKIGKDAIQIHGGIGFTDECDVQFFYKRAITANATFGDAHHHRERYAQLKGF